MGYIGNKYLTILCALSFLSFTTTTFGQDKIDSDPAYSANDSSKFTILLQTEKKAIVTLQERIAGWDFIILEIDEILTKINLLNKDSISKEVENLEKSIVIGENATENDVKKQLNILENKTQSIFKRVAIKELRDSFQSSLSKKWGPDLSQAPYIDYLNFIREFWDYRGDFRDYDDYFIYDNFKGCEFPSYNIDKSTRPTECYSTLNTFILNFDNYKKTLLDYFNQYKSTATERKNVLVDEVKRRQEAILAGEKELERVYALKAAQEKLRTIIDPSAERLILYTLIAWGVIIVVAVTGVLLVTHWRTKTIQDPLEFSFALFLQIVTVFLLTATILILGIAGKIDAEALAALIGGISGYVLGRLSTAPGKGGKTTT